jgi:predicted nucleic-acid-binding protein
VIGFDTNVLVRVLVGDDPVQTKKAENAFVRHARGEGVFVSLMVLAEISWVLSAAYKWDRATLHARVSQLVRTRGVFAESLELVERALGEYLRGKAELADYLILCRAREEATIEALVTFDKALARTKGVVLL